MAKQLSFMTETDTETDTETQTKTRAELLTIHWKYILKYVIKDDKIKTLSYIKAFEQKQIQEIKICAYRIVFNEKIKLLEMKYTVDWIKHKAHLEKGEEKISFKTIDKGNAFAIIQGPVSKFFDLAKERGLQITYTITFSNNVTEDTKVGLREELGLVPLDSSHDWLNEEMKGFREYSSNELDEQKLIINKKKSH